GQRRTVYDKARGDGGLKLDSPLDLTSAPACPRIGVQIDGRDRRARIDDEYVRIRRHAPGRRLGDPRGDVSGGGSDRKVPHAVRGERPEARIATRRERLLEEHDELRPIGDSALARVVDDPVAVRRGE